MLLEDIDVGMRVIYVPPQAHGDRHHPECQRGVVTSKDSQRVAVRYGTDRHSNVTAPALLLPDGPDEIPHGSRSALLCLSTAHPPVA